MKLLIATITLSMMSFSAFAGNGAYCPNKSGVKINAKTDNNYQQTVGLLLAKGNSKAHRSGKKSTRGSK